MKKSVALHGAVYGLNFGDVLIQNQIARLIKDRIDCRLWFPFGTRKFSKHSKFGVGRSYRILFTHFGVFGPGGYFGERSFSLAAWNRRLQNFHGKFFRLMQRANVPYSIFGVGIGPLSDTISRDLVLSICRSARTITVRDEPSREFLDQWGLQCANVRVCPDIALSVKKHDLPEEAKKYAASILHSDRYKKRVGIHIPSIDGLYDGKHLSLRKDLIEIIFKRDDLQFVLISDDPSCNVLQILREEWGQPANCIYANYENPECLLSILSSLDVVLTTKLHVGICTMSMGAMPIAVYQHSKVPRFFMQAGISDFCTSMANYRSGWIGNWLPSALDLDRSRVDDFVRLSDTEIHSCVSTLVDAHRGN